MWRALIIGDVHWRAENPIARVDHYQQAVHDKLYECWDLADTHGVDAIIQTGDLFDSPGIALTTIGDLMRIMNDAPAPVYSVAGNHDLYGHNPDSLYRTPIGLLFHLDVVKNAERVTPIDKGVCITGTGFSPMSDQGLYPYTDFPPNYDLAMVHVHITHGMLVNEPNPGRHTLISDLAGSDDLPEVLVNGHYHFGTGIQRVGKTLVINPGALVRTKADLREIDRTVNVALLEVTKKGTTSAELIALKSARPGAEVLSREHLIKQAERESRNREFLDLLTGDMKEALDLTSMVEEVAKNQALPEPVRLGALKRMGEAIEELASGGVSA